MVETPEPKPFEIFRAADYRDYGEHDLMELVGTTPAILEALGEFEHEGGGKGQTVRLAYSRPTMSLTHVWFKSGYPLPLHSHSGDCLYYLLAGSIRVGTETLGPGDGFFVASDVPYTYETGPDGAEVLEFRGTDWMNIRFMAKGKAAWDKTVGKLRAKRETWETEEAPSRKAVSVSTGQ
jgi:quercetin dioxygenase-like cupin family protein